ncbi:MAG: YncE family protein [Balneolaceae bacterium]
MLHRFLTPALVILVAFSAASVFAQGAIEGQRIYVCNQGEATVSVIDVATNELIDTIDLQELGFSANASPHHTIAEPDGSYWYVTLIGDNRVLKFNRDNELVDETEFEVPGLLTMHPDRETLFAGRSMSAVNPPGSFGIINRSDMTLQEEVNLFFSRPHAITNSPDGEWIYVGSLSVNQILSMNPQSEDVNLTVLGGDAHAFVNFAISPDGTTLVATGQVSGDVLIFDISTPESPRLTDTIEVNAQPWHPIFSPDGRYLYFGNKGANTVTVIDMQNRSVDAVIEGDGLAQPHGAALSADGRYLYISNNNRAGGHQHDMDMTEMDSSMPGTVTVINTETRAIEKVIEVGVYATGIGTNVRRDR